MHLICNSETPARMLIASAIAAFARRPGAPQLRLLRVNGESYSEVILRFVKTERIAP